MSRGDTATPLSVMDEVNAIKIVVSLTIWNPNKSEPPTPTSEPSKYSDQVCPSKRRISSSEKVTPPIEPLEAMERYSGLLDGAGVGVGVGVAVKVLVEVGVSVGRGVLVKVAVGPAVGVLVGVGLGPVVLVIVGVDVNVGVNVIVVVGVFVGVAGGGGSIEISHTLPSFSFGFEPVPLSLSIPRLAI